VDIGPMSNFSQQPNKLKVYLFLLMFLIVFTVEGAGALRMGASPPELNFQGKTGEGLCEDLTLFGDGYLRIFKIYDKWSYSKDKEISSYILDSKYFGIRGNYPPYIGVFEQNKLNLCFKANKSGNYYGLLFIESEEADAGLGIWLKLNITASQDDGRSFTLKQAMGRVGMLEMTFLAMVLLIALFLRR